MIIRVALLLTLFTIACDTPCANTSQCSEGSVCVPTLNRCRKRCVNPIDCSGSTLCSPVTEAVYACLNTTEVVRGPDTPSNDTSLGNQCSSPNNDGKSQSNDLMNACGDNAPLCNNVFQGDPGLGDVKTCTTECALDSNCAAEAPVGCVGDCKRDYDNMCCFPSLAIADSRQYGGNKLNAAGQVAAQFCRPRLFCYLVPKRCTADTDCGKTGSRAGDKCSKQTDGGGACLSGKLGLYECCQREGECDQKLEAAGNGGLSCTPSQDNLAAYCTKPCASDADCVSPNSPTATCWNTRYVDTGVVGKCRVDFNTSPICRNGPKPVIPSPSTMIVNCALEDRPAVRPDNAYNSSLRRCDRTF